MTSSSPFDSPTHRERGTKAYINTRHIQHNLKVIKKRHPGHVIAVVKANAYGHGISRVVPALSEADALAVATIEEAQALRAIDNDKKIILLEGVFNEQELAIAQSLNLDVVVHQNYQVEMLRCADFSNQLDVWLKIDSGMGRLGFDLTELDDQLNQLKQSAMVKQIRLMSHFASSDEPDCSQTVSQLDINQKLKSIGLEYSFSNTGAVLNGLSEQQEWVRVGLALYGVSPLNYPQWAASFDLLPAMHLTAKIIATKFIKKGDKVGYGGQFMAPGDMRIGILGIGYADGYPWSKHSTSVVLNGQTCAVLGRVSMDMIAIDISGYEDAMTGMEVTIWGNDLPIERVARDLELIPYALTCGITKRVKFYDNQ